MNFSIQSSDAELLANARRIAQDFARENTHEGICAIVFLGAIARGYFDRSADIDIALFKEPGAPVAQPPGYQQREGLEIHCFLTDYAEEVAAPWDMAKRWAFSYHSIFYDPLGLAARLLAEKLPLRAEERRWLMIEGMTQSDWYINTLTRMWVERGDLLSAHAMFARGVDHFLDALYGLNDQLVADVKWRYYCAQRLPRLPSGFSQRLERILLAQALSAAELEWRIQPFAEMWQEALPWVEAQVGMNYADFSQLV